MDVLFITLLDEIDNSCDHWLLRLKNKRLHGNHTDLPQLFLSGELHGDERVAPNALLELVRE